MIDGYRLFFDGWYSEKEMAEECLAQCESLGGLRVGLVQSPYDTWGILYLSRYVFFENHDLRDPQNATYSPLRPP